MKSFLVMAALATFASPSAFAMKKVQFDVRFNLNICPLAVDGKTCTMIDGGESQPAQTVVAEVDTSEDPNSQTVAFEKTYTLKRVFGAEADVDLSVTFSPDMFDKSMTEVSITLSDATESNGMRGDDSQTSLSVKDITTLGRLEATGKATFMPIANSPGIISQPMVWLENIKILE